MTDNITKLAVFIASPSDVSEERQRLQKVVEELNLGLAKANGLVLELVRWETHAWPSVGDDAQDVINRQIPIPDIFVGVLWKRFGTPTKRADSGTQEEFERTFNHWKKYRRPHILFYFSRKPYYPNSTEDLSQIEKVLQFRLRLQEQGVLFWEFEDAAQFETNVRTHLTNVILNKLDRTTGSFISGDVAHFLSHIGNLRSLFQNLESLEKAETMVSIIYMDLDDFTRFNNQNGSEEGDNFLSRLTGCLFEVIKYKGNLYRVSGDEFVALMPNHNNAEALATAERMRHSVLSVAPRTVTASLGIASSEQVNQSRLFWLAREAMMASKSTGKNKVVAQPLSGEYQRDEIEGVRFFS